ncbi:hypothetical protein [Paenibacillus xylanexedens]|uniref:hypothetical protein n=1 Tax=Paenibacillus xylanexedens TaxID=528191 RepID=UPI0011A03EE0|nr:hypothetical protein [Paenibacillus xylanexedens]
MRKHNKVTIKHIILTTLCFAMASIGIYGMLALSSNTTQPDPDQAQQQAPGTDSTGENTDHSTPTDSTGFQMTAGDFRNKFNAAVGKYRLNGLAITRLTMNGSSTDQATSTFEYAFNDELRMIGIVNADEQIQEIKLYGTGNVNEPTRGVLLTAIATLILTTHSEYTYNDAQDVIQDIGLLERDVNQSEFDETTIRDGFQYRFQVQNDGTSVFEITTVE